MQVSDGVTCCGVSFPKMRCGSGTERMGLLNNGGIAVHELQCHGANQLAAESKRAALAASGHRRSPVDTQKHICGRLKPSPDARRDMTLIS